MVMINVNDGSLFVFSFQLTRYINKTHSHEIILSCLRTKSYIPKNVENDMV